MADNVTLPGTGGIIASDEVGGAQYQRVKVTLGADGAASDLAPGQAAMVASVPVAIASDQSTVTVGTSDAVVTVTPTLDTNIYASGDLLFDSTEIANAVRANGGTAILQSVTLLDKDDQGMAMTLVFADAATDFGTLNSAPDPDDTEGETVLGTVAIATSDYVDFGAFRLATVKNVGLLLKAGAATTSLYVAAINGSGTPTYSASGTKIKIGLLRS